MTMLDQFKTKPRLSWISSRPSSTKKVAILIPQYNEASNFNIFKRLQHFDLIARNYSATLDVIIIDDGSTDESLVQIWKFYQTRHPYFQVASVLPNANKVGALYLVLQNIQHEFVILSDFDTDLGELDKLDHTLSCLESEDSLMGCYFRMLPFEGKGDLFLFQQLEYSLLRSLYRFHTADQSVVVMPGAGSCYKRHILLMIYQEHSGFRNGEDREATQIGHRLGYKAFYENKIVTLTRPPWSLKALIKQRVRWNLGYLETVVKEKTYYWSEMKKFSRLGIRILVDCVVLLFILLMPVFIIALGLFHIDYFLVFIISLYIFVLIWTINLIVVAPNETAELKGKRIGLILKYPAIKLFVDYFGWMGALLKISKRIQKR